MDFEGSATKHFKDLEDGEISDNSDEGYTPLQRPKIIPNVVPEPMITAPATSHSNNLNDCLSDFDCSSESTTDSDSRLQKNTKPMSAHKKKKKRPVYVRIPETSQLDKGKPKFQKYNVWTASLQEDSLMEHMRDIEVAKSNDRNVENYDYAFKFRSNAENLKRRRKSTASSLDDVSDCNGSYLRSKKRQKPDSNVRKSIKDRLGVRRDRNRCRRGRSTSSCDSQNAAKIIGDLNITDESKNEEIARELANKLREQKDDLLLRVIEIVGRKVPIEIFKQTQNIEKDGGMMIKNGQRRRTPGGVFLFLLKEHDTISEEDKKQIFKEEKQSFQKEQKLKQAKNRDKKVEELKKCLNQEPKGLTSRKESLLNMKPNEGTALSNPPPSPAASFGSEFSPEYKINHINDCNTEKTSTNSLTDECLNSYEEDFLDVNCCDMDLF